MKLIFCDINTSLVNKVEELFKNFKNNKWDLELSVHNGDIFELHKKVGGKIVTASNRNFTYGGGLDALIKKNFPDEVQENTEFEITENLFKTITVNSELQSNKKIIERALIGVFSYRYKLETILLTGIGTSIGGMSEEHFIEVFGKAISADLSSASLRYADLRYSDLRSANLRSANLRFADLSSANLRSADLSYADLRSTSLRSTGLSYADLSSADLSSASLFLADLRYSDLSYSDLRYSDLRSANLRSANLFGININENTCFFSLQCPEEGDFIAWKKCRNDTIVKLLIPEHAKRSSATTRKCRASEAKVLKIYDSNGKEINTTYSMHDTIFSYRVGETIRPTSEFDDDRWNECGNGIHFFLTRQEAEQWN